MSSKLYILHEYGAPRHFDSLVHLNNNTNKYKHIVSREFDIIKQVGKGILKWQPNYIWRALRNILGLIYLLISKDKDIIIGIAPYNILVYYVYLLKKKHRVTYYSSWPHWDFSKYPRKIYFKHQLVLWERFLTDINIVSVTNKVADGLRKYSSNITIIPHCIDKDVFNCDVEKSSDVTRFLFVGRLVEEKGIRQIIEVINALESKNGIEWWFVGSGDLQDEIINLSKVKQNVRFFGQVRDKNELGNIYRQCHVLLLPSLKNGKWEELFGIVLIEAMACGLVPIASNSIGPKAVITEGHDGFLIEMDTYREMYNKVMHLIENKEVYQIMSSAALETVKKYYTIQQTSIQWELALNKKEKISEQYSKKLRSLG